MSSDTLSVGYMAAVGNAQVNSSIAQTTFFSYPNKVSNLQQNINQTPGQVGQSYQNVQDYGSVEGQ